MKNDSHEKDCIFCKIAIHEIPANIIYEDEKYISFLDIRPLSPGHALVVPKAHHRWVWDVPNIGEYFEVVRKVAQAQKKAFNVELVMAKVVGEEVHHAHVWVFPSSDATGNKAEFEANQKKIIEAFL